MGKQKKRKSEDFGTIDYTETEWFADLNEIIQEKHKSASFTEEQIAFIKIARSQDPPISWSNICNIWKKQQTWNPIGREAIRIRWNNYCSNLQESE